MTTTRREFLKTSAGAATLIGIAGTCSGCALFHKRDVQFEAKPSATEAKLAFDAYPKLKEPNGYIRLKAKDGDLRLIVLRLPGDADKPGRIVALSMVCTHVGCDVDWKSKNQRFECPCHGSKFDPAGKVLDGPAEDPLPTYPIEESADGIVVHFTRNPA